MSIGAKQDNWKSAKGPRVSGYEDFLDDDQCISCHKRVPLNKAGICSGCWNYHEEQRTWEPSCLRCGYKGAGIDQHHIHGRKVSDETVYLCSNCHRELHAGVWSL